MTKNEFIDNFLNVFAKDITEKQKREAHVGINNRGCLWNLFGYKLLPCFEGNEARMEYNKANKENAFEFYFYDDSLCDDETAILNEAHLTAEQIDQEGLAEFYIVGKDFSWCYVVTHAGDHAGPYFCYAQNLGSIRQCIED